MINVPKGVKEPSNRRFTKTVYDDYQLLSNLLFIEKDGIKSFKRDYLLSPEMFSFLIVREWHRRLEKLEDIRPYVDWDCYQTIETYIGTCLESTDEDYISEPDKSEVAVNTQVNLLGYFIPQDGKPNTDTGRALYLAIVSLSIMFRMSQWKKQGLTDEQISEKLRDWVEVDSDASALRDCYYDAMGLIEESKKDPLLLESIYKMPSIANILRYLKYEYSIENVNVTDF